MQEIVKMFNDNPVRIIKKDGEPWFVAKDVCDVLEIQNVSQVIRRFDSDEKTIIPIATTRGNRQMAIINKSGLYRIIFNSHKKVAKEFKRWIQEDVNSSIYSSDVEYIQPDAVEVIHHAEVVGRKFQVYGTFEEPLFLAKDVAQWIEHSNTRMMLQSVDDDEKQCVNNPYALKGQQEQWFLTEHGMYEVLMLSRKPIAKQVKKQIKHILSTIRKTGAYLSPAMTDSQVQALMSTLEQEMYRRINAEGRLKLLENQLKKVAKKALPANFGELSKKNGLPKDKLVRPYARSDSKPHKPQLFEYFQLLLPLCFTEEICKYG